MSISVDDLVSSFASSHIGQEAIDLAALQAQLAQVLFGQPSAVEPTPMPAHYTQRCNTPIQRTPSFSFGHMQDAQRFMAESPRSPNSNNWRNTETFAQDDDMEDERMVEDLLLPSQHQARSPPQSPVPSKPFPAFPFSSPTSPLFPETTSFATSDPFFLAQAQAQAAPMPSTFFAQNGRPSQQSPFLMAQAASYPSMRDGYPFAGAGSQTMVSS
ncbi:hypothetical protein FB107DRAFT_276366 [Schizophyllum commune]